MNPAILNRAFEHPIDGWYHIEPKGEHPNECARLTQVVDDEACQSIVNRFNQDADAGQLTHGHEMLIDHEHFKHNASRETIAYGWLQRLQGRADGIYGQIRWSRTGQEAVDGGDYRFFSTEYDPADLKAVSDRSVRPLRLDGLTLTNDPNNKGARPITNRQRDNSERTVAAPTGSRSAAILVGAGAPAASQNETTQVNHQNMKNIANKLGLSAEANEDVILAELTRLQNRVTELQPLVEENQKLKNRQIELDGQNVNTLLAAHGVSDEKILNRLRPVLMSLAHADRQSFLEECVPSTRIAKVTASDPAQTKLHNRETRPPGGSQQPGGGASGADHAKAVKIMNRARELKAGTPNLSEATAVLMAQREMENS